jgi:hypothetical protein
MSACLTPTLPTMTACDLLVVAFRALSDEEQQDAFERIHALCVEAEASVGSETERLLASLKRATEIAGHVPSPDEYKEIRRARQGEEELAPLSQILRHFGAWRLAREAVELSKTTTARRIEARFRSRRLGKIWRYTEETLGETLAHCVRDLGRVPQVAEFEWWRERELELARAQGNDALHLPSPTPYRKRWKTWAAALAHFGYSAEAIAARLERG